MWPEFIEGQGVIRMVRVFLADVDESVMHWFERALAIESHQIEQRSGNAPIADFLDADIVFAGGDAKQYLPLLLGVRRERPALPFVVVTRIPETSEWLDAPEAAQPTTLQRRSNCGRSTGLWNRPCGTAEAQARKGRTRPLGAPRQAVGLGNSRQCFLKAVALRIETANIKPHADAPPDDHCSASAGSSPDSLEISAISVPNRAGTPSAEMAGVFRT